MDNVVCFDARLAKIIGIEESIIVYKLYGWIKHNAFEDKNMYDNKYWTYNSADAMSKDSQLQYMSESKISRILRDLVNDGFLVKGNYNKTLFDKTSWYSFGEKGISILKSINVDVSFLKNGECENEEPIPIIYNNNNNNKETNKENDEFIEEVYKMYPSKCPKRGTSLGKSRKDKEKIRKLLKTYSMEQIRNVVEHEIGEKYGKIMMQNFSTFLNNFPDPDTINVSDNKRKIENNNTEWQ